MSLIPLTTLEWIMVGSAAMLIGVSKAGFGAGAGILAIPIMTLVLKPSQMLAITLPVLICGDIFSLVHYPKTRDLRNLAMLVPGCLAGVGAGMLVLNWFLSLPAGETVMRKSVGGICTLFIFIQLYNWHRAKQEEDVVSAYHPAPWQGVGVGGIAGLTSTLAHAAGPVIALFLLPQKLNRRLFVGTCVTYFFIGNLLKLVPYFREGLFTGQTAGMSLALFPCVVAGTVVGAFLNKKMSDRIFTDIIYGLAFCTGVYLMLK